ncbi:MAG: hypothetical protein LBU62_02795 [Bacteroidales bacterium]|nr:hypothetical protein [Bacteroidales bacterium]
MLKVKTCFLLILLCALTANAQLRNADVYKLPEMDKSNTREMIRIPDFGGYHTMKCDFHTHTVFSDGSVWPAIRATEAWQTGLDAVAITDHLEHRPRKNILQGDHNEAYKIARQKGDEKGIIVIKGAEITRAKPLGHLNALFLTDSNPLDTEDPLKAIDIAVEQGAFIMWNHPGWPDNKSTLYPIHEQLIKEKKIHGVEVFNEFEYYPVSFDWCKNMNLAFMGNSDIHAPISELYGTEIRPMTLVFASERTEKGIKDALFAGRCAAFFNGQLAGRPEHLRALLKASLTLKTIQAEKGITDVSNHSDVSYTIAFDNKQITFPAGKTVRVTLPKTGKASVLNCFTGKDEHLTLDFPL